LVQWTDKYKNLDIEKFNFTIIIHSPITYIYQVNIRHSYTDFLPLYYLPSSIYFYIYLEAIYRVSQLSESCVGPLKTDAFLWGFWVAFFSNNCENAPKNPKNSYPWQHILMV